MTKTTINYQSSEDSDDSSFFQSVNILRYGSFEEKWVITKDLVKQGKSAIAPLKEIILSEDEEIETRSCALSVLAQIKSPEVILVAVELLDKTEKEELASLATEALAYQGRQSIVFLSRLLDNESYRYLATKALAQIPNTAVIEPLLSVVNDYSPRIRAIALCGLRNFHDARILKVMTKGLKDYNSQVRKEALVGMGLQKNRSKEVEISSTITPLLYDIDLSVAQQAIITLSKFNHATIVADALGKLTLSPHTPLTLKISAVKSLGWMETSSSIEWLGKIISSVELEVSLTIIKILGRIHNPELKVIASEILKNFYLREAPDNHNSEILQALCYSWKQIGAKESLPWLREMEKNKDSQVCYHAQSAIRLLAEVK